MVNVDDCAVVQPQWRHYRVIHSKLPPKNLFDVDDADAMLLGEVESMTNERMVNWRQYVAADDGRFGQGWGAVMAPFCYPRHGRFTTDDKGAYYCSDSAQTAIAQWSYHTARFWRQFGHDKEVSAVVRCYTGHFKEAIIDIRGCTELCQKDPSHEYRIHGEFAATARRQNAFGILYRSARREGGECAALLRPPATSALTQSAHYVLMFDGQAFREYAQLGDLKVIEDNSGQL
ncbi:MAG: RES family NAD+ phosphorylase [Algicola sp.]|nr:RES family NAD+ phosphorylase [Algicola sp.]